MPMFGDPNLSPASRAAFMIAVPKLEGSKRDGSDGVELERLLSFRIVKPLVAVEGWLKSWSEAISGLLGWRFSFVEEAL